jgi:hypothetical protein
MGRATAFLSSTYKDLIPFRDAVYDALSRIDGLTCVRMEDFGARPWDSAVFCQNKVAECDLFIGIIGLLHGSCPPQDERSYTELEFEAAADLPRLMFLAPDDFPVPGTLRASEHSWERQKAFRRRIKNALLYDGFRSPEDLAAKVSTAVGNWLTSTRVVRQEGRSPRVLPPRPDIVHPYPLQSNFTGRRRELAVLNRWITEASASFLTISALGGMGKSALAWKWVMDLLANGAPGLDGVFWWSFYESEPGFSAFLRRVLPYVSGGKVSPTSITSPFEQVRTLRQILQEHRFLLILDGFERELRAYAGLNAAYQGDALVKDSRGRFPIVYRSQRRGLSPFAGWRSLPKSHPDHYAPLPARTR